MLRINNYIEPDSLAIAIRLAGGSAWVESENGSDFVLTNRTLAWVRRLARSKGWIRPD